MRIIKSVEDFKADCMEVELQVLEAGIENMKSEAEEWKEAKDSYKEIDKYS